ncbi:hypothetical protein HK16_04010 [Acetobacter senegalensis]|uniref:Uncharacterized protein n=2 Tax=Acetobacter TaxID=434 RepID=A0A252EDM7_9PROT|nr:MULTISPECIES: hypothetical protein [Acetobacter]ATJ90407.1 hypothetical protein CIW82_06635 [Acetobacter tropicalis]OUL64588.1 hypothetical protein HK16_04010 [Acetobacter senegalensis]
MTTPTNWPNPERPGVPMFPEKDGKHVIDVDPEGNGSDLVYYWIAEHQVWVEYENENEAPDDALDGYDLIGWAYVGPCLTPAQIAEMLAAERERCLAAFAEHGERAELAYRDSASDEEKQYRRGALNTFEKCRDEIRNLGGAS